MTLPVSGTLAAHARTSAIATPRGGVRHILELVALSLALGYAVFLIGCAFQGFWLIDADGGTIANDFVNVWAAGKFALAGNPAGAYDWALHRAVEVTAIGHDFDGYYGWHYPPTFLFVAAALAMLPYLPAALASLALTLPAYLVAVRAIVGERIGIVLGCAFPGVIWNISAGQNGFLTAALIGGIAVNLTRRPVVAGICLGLLTYKPQFGILFPVVLAFDGRWRVIAAAAVTAAGLVAASMLAFGIASWQAFFTWMPVTSRAVFEDGRAGLNKLQSLFGVVRWLGGDMTAAWIAQGTLIAAAALALVILNRRRLPGEIKAAALAVAALLATPYLYIYDFPVLAIPLAFLMRLGLHDGFLPGEFAAIAAVCVLILAFPFIAMPTGFAAAIIVAALVARRALVAPTPALRTATAA
jgi:arabinofuranan 3-O-arabinosyltransferase